MQVAPPGLFAASRGVPLALPGTSPRSSSLPPCAIADGTLDTATAAARIQSWAATSGITADKVILADFPNTGRGMAATAPIAKDEDIVAIPRAVALQIAPTKACPFPDVDKTFWKERPWYVKMGILICKEKLRGEASAASEYVNQLPRAFDTLLFWSKEELARLQFSHLARRVAAQSAEWEGHHTALASSSPDAGVSRDQLFWAMSCARSRAFSGPYIGSTIKGRLRLAGLVSLLAGANAVFGIADTVTTLNAAISVMLFNLIYEVALSGRLRQYTMAPVIDFMNHRTTMNSEVTYNVFGDSFSVASGRDFAQGEEVFISYGVQTTDSLLQFYGFIEDGNPNDRFVFGELWEQLAAAGQLSEGQAHAVRALLGDRDVEVNNQGKVQKEVMQALRCVCSGEEGGNMAQFAQADAELDRKVWALLATIGAAQIELLPSTIQEDEAALKGDDLPCRQRLAIKYNLTRKVLLKGFIKTWKARARGEGE